MTSPRAAKEEWCWKHKERVGVSWKKILSPYSLCLKQWCRWFWLVFEKECRHRKLIIMTISLSLFSPLFIPKNSQPAKENERNERHIDTERVRSTFFSFHPFCLHEIRVVAMWPSIVLRSPWHHHRLLVIIIFLLVIRSSGPSMLSFFSKPFVPSIFLFLYLQPLRRGFRGLLFAIMCNHPESCLMCTRLSRNMLFCPFLSVLDTRVSLSLWWLLQQGKRADAERENKASFSYLETEEELFSLKQKTDFLIHYLMKNEETFHQQQDFTTWSHVVLQEMSSQHFTFENDVLDWICRLHTERTLLLISLLFPHDRNDMSLLQTVSHVISISSFRVCVWESGQTIRWSSFPSQKSLTPLLCRVTLFHSTFVMQPFAKEGQRERDVPSNYREKLLVGRSVFSSSSILLKVVLFRTAVDALNGQFNQTHTHTCRKEIENVGRMLHHRLQKERERDWKGEERSSSLLEWKGRTRYPLPLLFLSCYTSSSLVSVSLSFWFQSSSSSSSSFFVLLFASHVILVPSPPPLQSGTQLFCCCKRQPGVKRDSVGEEKA